MKADEVRQKGLEALKRMKRFDAKLAAIDDLEGFDSRFNVETGRPVEPWELEEATEATLANNSRYSPTPVRTIRCVIAASRPSHDDVFVDFDAGKARVMLVAADFPFKMIAGVEFSESLCEIARRNFGRLRMPFGKKGDSWDFSVNILSSSITTSKTWNG